MRATHSHATALMVALIVVDACLSAAISHAQPRSFAISQLPRTSATTLPSGSTSIRTMPAPAPYVTTATQRQPSSTKPTQSPGPSSPPSAPSTTLISATLAPTLNAPACTKALRLVVDLATVAYRQTPNPAYMQLAAQAVLIDDVVRANGLPNLTNFRNAVNALPWFGQLRAPLTTASTAVVTGCQPVGAIPATTPRTPPVSWPN